MIPGAIAQGAPSAPLARRGSWWKKGSPGRGDPFLRASEQRSVTENNKQPNQSRHEDLMAFFAEASFLGARGDVGYL